MAVAEKSPKLLWTAGPQAGSEVCDLRLAWTSYIPLKPTSKQLAFLLLPCLEALFGGAGGPGKSAALLMGALQYVNSPSYAALLIRKTFTDLSLPSALMDVAASWLSGTEAKWSDVEKTWHFSSGATLTFGYLDTTKDKFRYQSAAFQYIGFDELTQFPEMDYTFMFSRLRRLAGSDIPLRMRGASNPGNIGHDWVKKRFMDDHSPDRVFLRARIEDNPHLDIEEYRRSLAELDPITQRQIENGDWSARHGGSKFRREWFKIVEAAPIKAARVRRWDFAATEPKPGRDPDWTVGLKLARTSDNILYVEDVIRFRGSPLMVEQTVKQAADLDGKEIIIRAEQEPGSSGIRTIDDMMRRVLMGFDFKGVPSTGSKEIRANPVASQAEAGNIKLVKGRWIPAFLDELELFPSGSHDDQVDALSGALADLTSPGKPFRIG